MVRMIPDRTLSGTTLSEIEVFKLIRDAKGLDAFVCLHSLGIARHRRKDYAEADFVLIGPAGTFCLEVKGGNVHRKGGVWEIGWPGKSYTSAEGPFKQAEGARWALLDYLKVRLGDSVRKDMLLGWGVVFPDISFTERDPGWENDVIYDQRDKSNSFLDYTERLERYFRKRLEETGKLQPSKLGPARVNEIVNCLRGDFEVVKSFKGMLSDSERELIALSPQQYKLLDLALNDENQRILCNGAAGTGKTLIAMEAARRLSASGKRVLFLCFNHNLSRFLNLEAADSASSIKVTTVHRFLGDIIRRGGYRQQLAEAHARTPMNELFGDVYQDLFEKAAGTLMEENDLPQYDVVVIDEAQDVLNAPIMNCLDLVLDGGFSKGRWLVFMDNGLQAFVYGQMDKNVLAHLKSFGPVHFVLAENFRNPKHIVMEMCEITGSAKPICMRELTSNVEYRVYADEKEQARKLRAILVELLRDGVPARNITLLSAKKTDNATFVRSPPGVGKPICILGADEEAIAQDAITAATISSFKGLENDFVILTDLPTLSENADWARSIFYVGMTRPRTKLFALVEGSFLQNRIQI